MSKDNLRQMLKASKRGIQSLYRLAVLVSSTEVAGPVWVMRLLMCRETDYRLDVLSETKGAHVEVY